MRMTKTESNCILPLKTEVEGSTQETGEMSSQDFRSGGNQRRLKHTLKDLMTYRHTHDNHRQHKSKLRGQDHLKKAVEFRTRCHHERKLDADWWRAQLSHVILRPTSFSPPLHSPYILRPSDYLFQRSSFSRSLTYQKSNFDADGPCLELPMLRMRKTMHRPSSDIPRCSRQGR